MSSHINNKLWNFGRFCCLPETQQITPNCPESRSHSPSYTKLLPLPCTPQTVKNITVHARGWFLFQSILILLCVCLSSFCSYPCLQRTSTMWDSRRTEQPWRSAGCRKPCAVSRTPTLTCTLIPITVVFFFSCLSATKVWNEDFWSFAIDREPGQHSSQEYFSF